LPISGVGFGFGRQQPLAIPEVLGSPEFIFAHSRPESIAERIAWLARDAALRSKVGAAQRRRVLDHYTDEAIARRYAEFIIPRLAARRGRA
jgi:glycosyltransferase involved in cell wall biosynthesis